MNQDQLTSWLDAYGRAWETQDPGTVVKLFSDDATYQETPFVEPMRGRAAIRDYWSLKVERGQEEPRFSYEILALVGNTGIAHWRASFVRKTSKAKVKLDGIFLLTFDGEARCVELREWWVRKD